MDDGGEGEVSGSERGRLIFLHSVTNKKLSRGEALQTCF